MTENSDTQSLIRIFIYTHIAESRRASHCRAHRRRMSLSVEEARAALEALAASRQVILDPTTREVWMAGPFSAVPTRFRVHGTNASWWANCAWDMLGIPASLNQSVRIDATCADCNATFRLDVDRDIGPVSDEGLVHILLPATGGTPTSASREARCSSSGRRIISQMAGAAKCAARRGTESRPTWRLAKAWYVDRRDPDWRSRSREQAQAILDRVGLTDPFWKLG